jgi:hypothetical protein
VTSAPDEELHFLPLLEDAELKANDIQGTIASPDQIVSRVENREHLKEMISRPAQSRLFTPFMRLGRWLDQSLGYRTLLMTQ